MSWVLIRILCSGMPDTRLKTVRIACGAWVVIWTSRCWRTGFQSATMPHVSIDATWIRGMCIFCLTTTSAPARAASAFARSPDSQCHTWFVLVPLSGRTSGESGSRALNGSTTAWSGS